MVKGQFIDKQTRCMMLWDYESDDYPITYGWIQASDEDIEGLERIYSANKWYKALTGSSVTVPKGPIVFRGTITNVENAGTIRYEIRNESVSYPRLAYKEIYLMRGQEVPVEIEVVPVVGERGVLVNSVNRFIFRLLHIVYDDEGNIVDYVIDDNAEFDVYITDAPNIRLAGIYVNPLLDISQNAPFPLEPTVANYGYGSHGFTLEATVGNNVFSKDYTISGTGDQFTSTSIEELEVSSDIAGDVEVCCKITRQYTL